MCVKNDELKAKILSEVSCCSISFDELTKKFPSVSKGDVEKTLQELCYESSVGKIISGDVVKYVVRYQIQRVSYK